MLSLASKSVKDASVLRRLQFAASFYPKDLPNYSENIIAFALKGKEDRNSLNPDQALQLVENMQCLDSGSLISEVELIKEIVLMKRAGSDAPLGIVLLSRKTKCKYCGNKLYIRSNRVSRVTIYSDHLGTLPATHFTQYCRKRGCSFQQHYGYYTKGDSSEVKTGRNSHTSCQLGRQHSVWICSIGLTRKS